MQTAKFSTIPDLAVNKKRFCERGRALSGSVGMRDLASSLKCASEQTESCKYFFARQPVTKAKSWRGNPCLFGKGPSVWIWIVLGGFCRGGFPCCTFVFWRRPHVRVPFNHQFPGFAHLDPPMKQIDGFVQRYAVREFQAKRHIGKRCQGHPGNPVNMALARYSGRLRIWPMSACAGRTKF